MDSHYCWPVVSSDLVSYTAVVCNFISPNELSIWTLKIMSEISNRIWLNFILWSALSHLYCLDWCLTNTTEYRVPLNFHHYTIVKCQNYGPSLSHAIQWRTKLPQHSKFITTATKSQRIHDYDPANHLRFQNPHDFGSLIHSWQVKAVVSFSRFVIRQGAVQPYSKDVKSF